MARSRIIKPEFFRSEQLVNLPPLARLLYIGLWTEADRDGRLEDRPLKIKLAVLPLENCDVDALLGQLADNGLIVRYGVAAKRYIAIPTFRRHQSPHPGEKSQMIPPPPDVSGLDQSGAGTVQVCDRSAARTQQDCDRSDTGIGPTPSLSLSLSLSSSDSISVSNSSARPPDADSDLSLANEIWQAVLRLNPNAKLPNLETWAKEIWLMRQHDGRDRTVDGIRDLFRWANGHQFWQSNVLCPAALRKHWDRLTVQKEQESNGNIRPRVNGRVEPAGPKKTGRVAF